MRELGRGKAHLGVAKVSERYSAAPQAHEQIIRMIHFREIIQKRAARDIATSKRKRHDAGVRRLTHKLFDDMIGHDHRGEPPSLKLVLVTVFAACCIVR